MTDIFYYTTMILFVVVAIILMLLILIQKGRGGGLASAFGGVGGHSAFGSKTGDVLTWATAILFGVYLLLGIFSNKAFNRVNDEKHVTAAAVVPAGASGQPAGPTNSGTDPDVNVPGSPESSLPQAPITSDPGISNPPPPATTDKPAPAPQPELSTTKGPTTRP